MGSSLSFCGRQLPFLDRPGRSRSPQAVAILEPNRTRSGLTPDKPSMQPAVSARNASSGGGAGFQATVGAWLGDLLRVF